MAGQHSNKTARSLSQASFLSGRLEPSGSNTKILSTEQRTLIFRRSSEQAVSWVAGSGRKAGETCGPIRGRHRGELLSAGPAGRVGSAANENCLSDHVITRQINRQTAPNKIQLVHCHHSYFHSQTQHIRNIYTFLNLTTEQAG